VEIENHLPVRREGQTAPGERPPRSCDERWEKRVEAADLLEEGDALRRALARGPRRLRVQVQGMSEEDHINGGGDGWAQNVGQLDRGDLCRQEVSTEIARMRDPERWRVLGRPVAALAHGLDHAFQPPVHLSARVARP
jgi:hypothetical protein